MKKIFSHLSLKANYKNPTALLLGILFGVLFFFTIKINSAEKPKDYTYKNIYSYDNVNKKLYSQIQDLSQRMREAKGYREYVNVQDIKSDCDSIRDDTNTIQLSSNGTACKLGLLRQLNVSWGVRLDKLTAIDIYYSPGDEHSYSKIQTHLRSDYNKTKDSSVDFRNFAFYKPGSYRAVLTYSSCDFNPVSDGSSTNIPLNKGQRLSELAQFKDTDADFLDPEIVAINSDNKEVPVPLEICDLSGLTLKVKTKEIDGITFSYKWYVDGVKQADTTNTIRITQHLDTNPNIKHKIKVVIFPSNEGGDTSCSQHLPSAEVTIKRVWPKPKVALYANDKRILQDSPSTHEYYFKENETIKLKATHEVAQNGQLNFAKYQWLKNGSPISTDPTITITNPQDRDTYKVIAHDEINGNCDGDATVIIRKAYKYSPTFKIKNAVIENDTALFCQEVPKNTHIELNDQTFADGKRALELMLQDDPHAAIEWEQGTHDISRSKGIIPLKKDNNESPDVSPNVSRGEKDDYHIQIRAKTNRVEIDTNSQAYRGITIDSTKVPKPIIKENKTDINVCKDLKTGIPETNIIVTNKGSYDIQWYIDGKIQPNNTDTLIIPNNISEGKHVVGVKFKIKRNSLECTSDETKIDLNVYDDPSPVITYKNTSGIFISLDTNQYLCKNPEETTLLYLKEKRGTSDIPGKSVVEWEQSYDLKSFTKINSKPNILTIDKDLQKINTIAYYRATVTHPEDQGGCINTSDPIMIVSFKPSIKAANNKIISCNNEGIDLTVEALNAQGNDIISPNTGKWEYKATKEGQWNDISGGRLKNSYRATKTGYYRAIASPYISGATAANSCKKATEPIYITVEAPIEPVIHLERTELCSEEDGITLSVTDKDGEPYPNQYTYTWYFNNQLIDDAHKSTYNATQVGKYKVEVKDPATACSGLSEVVDITESKLNSDFNIEKQNQSFICIENGQESNNLIKLKAVQQGAQYLWSIKTPGSDSKVITSDEVEVYKNKPEIILSDLVAGKYQEERFKSGTYEINLTVSENGCVKQTIKYLTIIYKTDIQYKVLKNDVEIKNKDDVYTICKNDTVTIKTNVNKYNNGSNIKIRYKWFRDNTEIGEHTYDDKYQIDVHEAGSYYVEAYLIDLQNNNQYCVIRGKPITIKTSEVNADFETSNSNCIDENSTIKLTPKQNTNQSYKWFELINGQAKEIGSNKTLDIKLEAGIHKIRLTTIDVNGCTDTVDKDITVTYKPTVNIHIDGKSRLICNDDPVIIKVRKNRTKAIYKSYKWQIKNNGSWEDVQGQTGDTLKTNKPGEYRVIVTNDEDCQNASNSVIVKKQTLTADFTPKDSTFCFVSTDKKVINLRATQQGAETYEWRVTNGISTQSYTGQNYDLPVTKSGVYKITLVVKNKNCVIQGQREIAVLMKPDIIYSLSKNVFCPNPDDLITLTSKINYTLPVRYRWYKGDLLLGSQEPSIDVQEEGTYHLEIDLISPLDDKTVVCSVVGRDVTIRRSHLDANFKVSGNKCTEASHAGVLLKATDTTGENYKWIIKNSDKQVIKRVKGKENTVQLPIGIYNITLSIRDASNCLVEKTQTIEVTEAPKVELQSNSNNNKLCKDSSITLTVRAKNSDDIVYKDYTWYKQNGVNWEIIPNEKTSVLQIKIAGTYKVIVTDKNSCKGETNTITIENSNVSADFKVSPKDLSCLPLKTPITLTATDTSKGNIYKWVNVKSKQTIYEGKNPIASVNLPEGVNDIQLTVTNIDSCQATSQQTLNIGYQATPKIIADSSTICITKANGVTDVNSVELQAVKEDNSESDYKSYQWQKQDANNNWINIPKATGKIYTVSTKGTYRVTVENLSRCQGASQPVTINEVITDLNFSNNIYNEQDIHHSYILLCIQKGEQIQFTANEKNANTYKWSTTEGRAEITGENQREMTLTPIKEGPEGVTLTMESEQCKSSNSKEYFIIFKPKVTIKKSPQKDDLCSNNDTIELKAEEDVDSDKDGLVRYYKWYKKVDNGASWVQVGSDQTLKVKEKGEYYVEVIKQAVSEDLNCSSESEPVKIGFTDVNAIHNYTGKTEIKCLEKDAIEFVADYATGTAKYKWVITNETTGKIDTSENLVFNYPITNEGKYKVQLIVTDKSCTITSDQEINISVKPPKVSLKTEQGKKTYCSYETIKLIATLAEHNKKLDVKYQWLYSSDNKVPSYWSPIKLTDENTLEVSKTGYYKVIVKTKMGCQEESEPIYIVKSGLSIIPSIQKQDCLNPNDEVVFNNTTDYHSAKIKRVTWNFGDLTEPVDDINPIVRHKYVQKGNYDVSITVETDEGCTFTKTIPVVIKNIPTPQAKIRIQEKQSYCQSDTVTVTDATTHRGDNYIAAWKVLLNNKDVTEDVAKITGDTLILTPLRSTDKDSEYTITLTATNKELNSLGCTDTTSKTISIIAQPIIEFDDIEKDICIDHEPIKLNGHYIYSGKDKITETYEYLKHGTNNRKALNTNILDPKTIGEGKYTLFYKVSVHNDTTNKENCSEELSKEITIYDYKRPKIRIQGKDQADAVCDGTSIILESIEDMPNYQWYKDGQLIPHADAKTFSADQTGRYHVETHYEFCGKKASNSIVITVHYRPSAKFTIPEEEDCKTRKIKFKNQSSSRGGSMLKYEWDFGDGTKSTEKEPEHTYLAKIASYVVTLTVTNEEGCSDTAKQILQYRKIIPDVDFDLIAQCVTDPVTAQSHIQMYTGSSYTVEWTLAADEKVIETQEGQNFSYLLPKEYATKNLFLEMKVTTDEGCVAKTRKPLKLKALPPINIGFKQLTLCSEAGYIDLKTKASPHTGGKWYIVKPGSNNSEEEPIDNGLLDVSVLIPAVYKIRFEYQDSATSCKNFDEAEVKIIEEPYVEIEAISKNGFTYDKTDPDNKILHLCDAEDLELHAKVHSEAATDEMQFTWYKDGVVIKGENNDQLHIKSAGTYEVHATAKHSLGCKAEARLKVQLDPTYHVKIDPKPIEVCHNAKPFKLTFGSVDHTSSKVIGTEHYYIMDKNKKAEEIDMFDPSKYIGDVEVMYEFVSFNGCKDSKKKTIKIVQPIGTVNKLITVKEGQSVTINNTLSFGDDVTTSYKWTPSTYLDADDIASPTTTPKKDIIYNLKLSSSRGCDYDYKIKVSVIPNIHVPNVITPNSKSSANSVLHIKGIEKYPHAIITIVNRLGQKVWESEPGYPAPWDGTDKNGQPLEIGTYYYILKPNKISDELGEPISSEAIEENNSVDDLTGYIEIIY